MATILTRADLATISSSPKVQRALEEQQTQVQDTAATVVDNVAATQALNDATVLTLSSNATLNNERVVASGRGIQFVDNGPGGTLVIQTSYRLNLNGGYRLTLNLAADTDLDVPPSGRLLTLEALTGEPVGAGLVSAANDAAAAAAGVPVSGLYHTLGVLHVRLT